MEMTEYSDHHPRHAAALPQLSYKPNAASPSSKKNRWKNLCLFIFGLLTLGNTALVLLHLFNKDTFLPTPAPTSLPTYHPTPPPTKSTPLSNLLYKTTVTDYPTTLKKRKNRFLMDLGSDSSVAKITAIYRETSDADDIDYYELKLKPAGYLTLTVKSGEDYVIPEFDLESTETPSEKALKTTSKVVSKIVKYNAEGDLHLYDVNNVLLNDNTETCGCDDSSQLRKKEEKAKQWDEVQTDAAQDWEAEEEVTKYGTAVPCDGAQRIFSITNDHKVTYASDEMENYITLSRTNNILQITSNSPDKLCLIVERLEKAGSFDKLQFTVQDGTETTQLYFAGRTDAAGMNRADVDKEDYDYEYQVNPGDRTPRAGCDNCANNPSGCCCKECANPCSNNEDKCNACTPEKAQCYPGAADSLQTPIYSAAHPLNRRLWGAATKPWSAWHYYWVTGTVPDYKQHSCCGCVSGCGPVAWAQSFNWADRRAQTTSYWSKNIYLSKGYFGFPAVGPTNWPSTFLGQKPLKAFIQKIRSKVGTFCFAGSGATTLWGMDNVNSWFKARNGGHGGVSTKYNVFGWKEDRLMRCARYEIKNLKRPVVLGTGWLEHYPSGVGYAFRQRRRKSCGLCPWYWQVSRWFYVKQGWGGYQNKWIPAKTFFCGRIRS